MTCLLEDSNTTPCQVSSCCISVCFSLVRMP